MTHSDTDNTGQKMAACPHGCGDFVRSYLPGHIKTVHAPTAPQDSGDRVDTELDKLVRLHEDRTTGSCCLREPSVRAAIELLLRQGQQAVAQLILNTCKYKGSELYLSATAVESLLKDLKNNDDSHKALTALARLQSNLPRQDNNKDK